MSYQFCLKSLIKLLKIIVNFVYMMKRYVLFFILILLLPMTGCREETLYDAAVAETIADADIALASGTDVPRPSDAPGGETYGIIKRQGKALADCGSAYRLTSDKKYADWASEILCAYARMYPVLDYHPESWRTAEPGRLFWQVLDESEWAFSAASGYLEMKDAMSGESRALIEDGLFRPMARFLMYGTEDNAKNNYVFNRMHNHGTWLDAAVGTIGLALGDRDYVLRSLYGTDLSGEHGGLLRQIEQLFSPDGYYMEGTVYQSFALIPFLEFGFLLRQEMPELDFLDTKGNTLARSADAMFGLSYDGAFFRLNDSYAETFSSRDVAEVLPYLYSLAPEKKWLLSIIRDHTGKVSADLPGLRASKDIAAGLAVPFRPASMKVCDGPDGNAGATMVLRGNEEESPAVYMKACGQGSYHGHFDKLTIGYFDNGNEILKEYGAARFNGIGPRNAGHYTPLNRGYAMTTVAHNTLVVDGRSHFDGVTPYGLPHSPRAIAFKGDVGELQYMAAVDSTAYPGVRIERWIALVAVPFLERPFIADILIADSDRTHTYDYPIHYSGQMIHVSAPYTKSMERMEALGTDFGYQHLWLEAEGEGNPETTSYTWLDGGRFYTISTATTTNSKFMFLRTGANDQDCYLRSEPVYMIREESADIHVFASCLESHGSYSEKNEKCLSPLPECEGITVFRTADSTIVAYQFRGGHSVELSISGSNITEKII